MSIQLCIGHSGVYRGHYRDVKGRLFVCYESYLVLLKYMIGQTYIMAVVRWNNHWWGVETTREMSQLSERADGHK